MLTIAVMALRLLTDLPFWDGAHHTVTRNPKCSVHEKIGRFIGYNAHIAIFLEETRISVARRVEPAPQAHSAPPACQSVEEE